MWQTVEQGEDWPDLDKIAAVVLDLNLPDGTGMDLLALAKARLQVAGRDPDGARQLAGKGGGLERWS
jgi:CheY-like chemotaxis protein